MPKTNEEYQLDLQEKKELLQKCQKQKSLSSCMECEEIFSCKTREEYVKSVYDSMSHGQSGGFEF